MRALGNAVVPDVAEAVGRAILAAQRWLDQGRAGLGSADDRVRDASQGRREHAIATDGTGMHPKRASFR